MPRPYPEPIFNDTSSMFGYSNLVTNDYFSVLASMAMFAVFFILAKRKIYKISDSFLVASFLTMFMSSFLWAAGLLAGKIIILYLVFTIISAIWSALD